jgi:hypothetical protein
VTETDKLKHAKQQAQAQFEFIKEMVEGLDDDADEARERIQEDALSVQVRSGWYDPGTMDVKPEEFEILLCTGGPAVRIIGSLSEHGEPEDARLECQDWFQPWTDYMPSGIDGAIARGWRDVLLAYARCFYFGE